MGIILGMIRPNRGLVREYKARGILHDVEIGVDSDMVSATFAG